jgi:hypothetical protein
MAGGIEVPEAAVEAAAGAAASQRVVFVLEGASLEVAKVGKSYELLNADDHAGFLRRHNKDPALYRPDICHQVRSVSGASGGAIGAAVGDADGGGSRRRNYRHRFLIYLMPTRCPLTPPSHTPAGAPRDPRLAAE